jgi:hypothetical protein
MKKTLILSATLLGLMQAQAQTQMPFTKSFRGQHKEQHLLKSILSKQTPATAQRPTGLHQRVVAQTLESVFSGSADSTTFRYNGAKGSTYDFNNLEYTYNSQFSYDYDPIYRFPGYVNPMNVLADTIKTYSDGEMTSSAYAHYRADNKIDSSFLSYDDGSGNWESAGFHNSFNAQGALVYTNTLQGTPPETTYAHKYVYNTGSTRLESDTTFIAFSGTPVPVGAVTYHYNAGKLDSATFWDYDGMGLILGSRIKMTYNTAGKLVTLKSYFYETGVPMPTYTDSLGYTAGADYYTFFQEEYYDIDGLISDGYREVKYVGANGLPDSIKAFEKEDALSDYEYVAKLTPTYNSFNNPETFLITTPTTGPTPVGRFSFYYETWDDGLSIKPVAENKELSVYPNPFTDKINIDWKGQQQSNVTVRLTNMVGQEIYKSSVRLSTGRNAIVMPALSSGNYILIIQDGAGKSWSNKMVKK